MQFQLRAYTKGIAGKYLSFRQRAYFCHVQQHLAFIYMCMQRKECV